MLSFLVSDNELGTSCCWSFQCRTTPAMMNALVIKYVRKINVRMIDILSLSLSHLDAFSPNAFDHHLHAVRCFISLIVSVIELPPTVVDTLTNTHLLTYALIDECK
jgi:hypothetical protein